MRTYFVDESRFYTDEPYVEKNEFKNQKPENAEVPVYNNIKDKLPQIIWDNHENAIKCYEKTWEIAFNNIKKPYEGSGFVSNFIDTAFNGAIFMWDSSFMMMFGKYGIKAFDFQQTFNNFYAKQHKDGFICREIRESDGGDYFTRFDPISTGPDIMGWAEWEYYKFTGNKERLKRVFDPLMAFHKWMHNNRTWRDGSYWSSGWGCGMDNIPRLEEGYDIQFSHGHMVWIDTCFQAVLSADMLIKIANEIGRTDEVKDIIREKEMLNNYINDNLWDDVTGFYYDKWKNGEFNYVKTIGSYWGLLSGSMPETRMNKMVSYLDDDSKFRSVHRIPTLSRDDKYYNSEGGYWCGSVWAPTNYMVLCGLRNNGYDTLAYEIALNHHENVVESFNRTGTVWENYCQEQYGVKSSSRGDFVGWTGLVPIAVLIEFVFGIRIDYLERKIVWNLNRMEEHGVKNLPFGDGTVSLICKGRKSETDVLHIVAESDCDVELEIISNRKRQRIHIYKSEKCDRIIK